MTSIIAEVITRLTPDPWRSEAGFSPELEQAQDALWAAASQDAAVITLREWLARHQPCLFGRIAAKQNLLTICLLTEDDLRKSDDHIRERIQAARSDWTRDAFEGRKSGFVIVALSPALALASPDHVVQALAQRLTSLYLLAEIEIDRIYLEEVFLEMPSHRRTTWRWSAGVNYFAAHGDRRWWNDHRFPGGIALSVNSVGHMARAGAIGRAQRELEAAIGAPEDGWLPTKIDSLSEALEFAMRTIDMASDTVSGPATRLLPAPTGVAALRCPIELPRNLVGKDCRTYEGYYHTDVTLPSLYFRADVERPADTAALRLDFTYLSDAGLHNPDYITMGTGRRIRSAGSLTETQVGRALHTAHGPKADRVKPEIADVSSSARLRAALGTSRQT